MKKTATILILVVPGKRQCRGAINFRESVIVEGCRPCRWSMLPLPPPPGLPPPPVEHSPGTLGQLLSLATSISFLVAGVLIALITRRYHSKYPLGIWPLHRLVTCCQLVCCAARSVHFMLQVFPSKFLCASTNSTATISRVSLLVLQGIGDSSSWMVFSLLTLFVEEVRRSTLTAKVDARSVRKLRCVVLVIISIGACAQLITSTTIYYTARVSVRVSPENECVYWALPTRSAAYIRDPYTIVHTLLCWMTGICFCMSSVQQLRNIQRSAAILDQEPLVEVPCTSPMSPLREPLRSYSQSLNSMRPHRNGNASSSRSRELASSYLRDRSVRMLVIRWVAMVASAAAFLLGQGLLDVGTIVWSALSHEDLLSPWFMVVYFGALEALPLTVLTAAPALSLSLSPLHPPTHTHTSPHTLTSSSP